MEITQSLKYVIDFYEEAVSQLVKSANTTDEKASLKVGIMILYFWASVYNNEEVIKSVKEEGDKYLTNSDEFFLEASQDFKKLKEAKHPIIDNLAKLSADDYNQLIEYFQKNLR